MLTISEHIINEQIRDKEVRVIGEDGAQLGIMSSKEAQMLAREANLDLIKIAPKATPPVCKIIDYGKYRYEQAKREKENRKKQTVISVKEIRLSPNIEDHDINTKMNMATKFLNNGDKVKIVVRFRGREMAHTEFGREILTDCFAKLEEIADIESQPKLEGKNMVMVLMPKKTK